MISNKKEYLDVLSGTLIDSSLLKFCLIFDILSFSLKRKESF